MYANGERHPNEMKVFSIWLQFYYEIARQEGHTQFPLMDFALDVPMRTWIELRDLFIARQAPFDAVIYGLLPF